MKGQALALVNGIEDPAQALNRLREYLQARIVAADFDGIIADARPFLERPRDAALLTSENLLALLPSDEK